MSNPESQPAVEAKSKQPWINPVVTTVKAGDAEAGVNTLPDATNTAS